MMNGWKYFDLAVDIHNNRLTPVDEILGPSTIVPNALVSANCLSRSAASFIYRFDETPTELIRQGKKQNTIIEIEMLQDTDGYVNLYFHTEMRNGHLLHEIKRTNPIIVEMPVEYRDDLIANVRILGPDRIIDSTYEDLDECKGISLKKVGYNRPTSNDHLAMLTDRQMEVLRAALREGYYEIPRQTDQEALGELFDVEPQTVGEHLRKIESKVIKQASVSAKSTSPASQTNGITEKAGD